ncbi:hypothetical protein GOM49_15305 [Clostridium bovifaecis]|uniref:Uncharacterized protein n=1 Tax=Clostridium bovifaecis TaxID=2184719 RepID=A0A6I6F7J2_9CLOT|nr:hypothetical protein GOM49_15305 [Clostridium bovifaecis]
MKQELMNNRESHDVNRRLFNRKGYKSTENQFAKNQIVQTIESTDYNKSEIEAKKKYELD